MWTYSGMLIEKHGKEHKVYANDFSVLNLFADGQGKLHPEYLNGIKELMKEDGLYQALIGYGDRSGFQDPCIYFVLNICNIDWEFIHNKMKEANKLIEEEHTE